MNNTMGLCPGDYSFGPQTSPECRQGLDLTLVFEESILSLLPASLMIVASTARYFVLRKTRRVVSTRSFYSTKSFQLGVLVVLRLVLLLLWSIRPPVQTRTSIAAVSVFLLESFAFVLITRWEHAHSLRPSSLLSLYYLFSLGFDFIRMRTLIEMEFDSLIVALAAADMAIKTSLLFAEAQNKRAFFVAADLERPPQETSGIYSRSVFWWLNSLFSQGYNKILTLNDLFKLDEELSSEETYAMFESKWMAMFSASNHRLGRTVILSLRSLFFAPVLPNLLVMSLTFAQPFLVTALLTFISSTDSKELGYLIVAGYAVVFIGLSVCTAFYTHQLDRFMTMLRGCLVNIIYNQTLKLDMKEAARGDSLTLMSADVEHIVRGFGLLHEASSNATMSIVALGLLYRQLGLSFLAPLIFSAILSYLSGRGTGPYIQRQKTWLEATEKRVSFTASVIASMKGVKILGLAESVGSRLSALRHVEVEKAKRVRIFYAIFTVLQTLSLSGTRWVTYTTFGIVALLSSSLGLNITVLFTSLAILQIFMERLEIFLRQMPTIASSFGCLRRIELFLLLETKRDSRLVENADSTHSSASNTYELQHLVPNAPAISMKDLSIGWSREDVILQNINIDIPKGSMTMIIGPVGTGKSTLMQVLLGETVTQKGFLSVASKKSIAFCAQTPWLINKSIQQNILGNSVFDGPWYLEILQACALLDDLRLYPDGDRTLVGSKGMTLSGGQKQRIALARAVYSRKPLVLLDDIFSGLDPVTENVIFQSLLGPQGILRRASQTVLLSTHAVHFLSSADIVILLGENSEVVYQGAYTDFSQSLISMRDLRSPSDLSSPEKVQLTVHAIEATDFEPIFHPLATDTDTAAPDVSRQVGDSKIYMYYIEKMGFKHALFFVLLGAICMGFTPAQSLWLNAWANDTDSSGKIPYYLGIYSIFFVGEIALTTLWIWHVLIFPLSASSIRLHDIQLDAMMRATMAFFSTTDTGITTNRFSQDLMLIDDELPLAMIDLVEYIFNCLYKMILIGVSTAYIVPTFPFLLVAFYLVQRFYLRTSRQIRYIDLETKSPLYTHFLESLTGLSTIRAFGWEGEFERQNRLLLQASQRPFFLLATIQRWLTLMLALIVSVLATVLAIVAVELRDSISPGLLGLALVNVMALGLSLKSLVGFWTTLETSIGAVSRIKKFSETTPSEEDYAMGLQLPRAPDTWLHSGRIDIKNMSASHGPNSAPVLHDITLSIAPGEKVAVCGRSGSGKSSLLSVLLLLLDVHADSSVHIDDTDITRISRNQVRGALNTLSQDPFFLHGSVRTNLVVTASASSTSFSSSSSLKPRLETGKTPEEKTEAGTDKRLEQVLKRVGLWLKIQDLGGLDTILDEETFSHGERQLFCLARALLNPSRILLLDEFTSSMDIETDRAMQQIIREDLGDRTIVAVAHRLESIIDFDRVVVLDRGRIVEDGAPAQLLKIHDSAFRVLWEAYVSEK